MLKEVKELKVLTKELKVLKETHHKELREHKVPIQEPKELKGRKETKVYKELKENYKERKALKVM